MRRDHSLAAMYIMTDAEGFTTCIEVEMHSSPRKNEIAMLIELGRRPMLAPITCYYWLRTGKGDQWKRIDTWEWSPSRGA